MRDERKLFYFLLCYTCLLLVSVWQLGLIESTEARYGEIAREMLASGNFLEPRFNGIYHFHKPPLPYWAMAAGMALFGINDFGVRFFGVISAAMALYFFYRTAEVIFAGRRQAFSALLVLASSVLFMAIARLASTDIYLTCCVMGAQFFLFSQVYGEHSRRNALGYGLMLGLGFMVKGPVIFLFTLLPQLAAKLVDQRHRRLFTWVDVAVGAGCFLAVSTPWYIAVISKHPDLFSYFTMTQTVDRFASERFKRDEPVWFFPLLFAGTFLPYSFYLFRGVCNYRAWSPRFRAQLLYLLLPLVVFCASKSKLPPYIVPFYGTAALMAVYVYQEFKSRWDDRVAFIFLLTLTAGLAVAGFVSPRLEAARLPLALSGSAALLVVISLRRLISTDKILPAVAGLLIAVTTLCYLFMPLLDKQMKSYKQMVLQLNLLDPQRKIPTVVYKGFLPSISFYRQNLAIMVEGSKTRELKFETDDAYRQWYFESLTEMNRAMSREERLFLVTEPQNIAEFAQGSGFACSEMFVKKKHTAYDCRR